jgi:hypothetical protein
VLPQEKEAIVALVSSILYTAALLALRPALGALQIAATFAALLAFILTLWAGRAVVGLRSSRLDERDLAIRHRAGEIAIHGFGAAVMAGTAILCYVHRATDLLPAPQVALLAFLSWTGMYLVWSVAVLVLYRRAG